MSLQLAFRHYDSLTLLGRALDDLAHCSLFEGFSESATAQENWHSPTVQQVNQLKALAKGVYEASHMLSAIQLSILNDNLGNAATLSQRWANSPGSDAAAVTSI